MSAGKNSRDRYLQPTLPIRPRSCGVVDTYVQKRLSPDVHPAFKALRNYEEATLELPQIPWNDEQLALLVPHSQLNGKERNVSEAKNVEGREGESGNESQEDDQFEELYRDANSEMQRFKAAMEAYETSTKSSKYKTNISSQSTHTWDEVLVEVENAVREYDSCTGLWGKIRKGLRSFGRNHSAFGAWMDLLPSQSEHVSVLCGGFKLILGVSPNSIVFLIMYELTDDRKAARRLHDLREDICDTLAQIPVLLACTHKALGIFKSKDLHQCSAALYISTLAALSHIITWYKEKAIKKMRSLFLQDSYEEQLSDKLQAIKTHAEIFEKTARSCSYVMLGNTQRTVQSHYQLSRENQQELRESRQESSQQASILAGMIMGGAANTRRMMEVESDRIMEQLKDTLENFLSSHARIDFRTQDARLRVQQIMLSSLDYEGSVLLRDVDVNLRATWTLPLQDQDRALAIMQCPKLHEWIINPMSCVLFINGNHRGSPRQQPTSVVCAKLADSIWHPAVDSWRPYAATTFALAFFCGEHRRPDDYDYGMNGMMRSLVAQLLVAYPTSDLRTVSRLENLQGDDIQDLCTMFETLITKLPPTAVVFCIIDGITLHEENKELLDEVEYVVQALVNIAGRANATIKGYGGCAFKLLFMSPTNSRVLYKVMPDPELDVIWMPASVPSKGWLTEGKWNASVLL
ncbi:hypothetical protein FGG08_006834 [Glutinoglossum americanum]|uniref:Uncharacterized protein n=1 Tax=Glutinoglossum americanum TaxID=1670608 RepID=A0A9P8KZY7_9PEZI|nr:hypothetical protein FGG08_006834 [Glutinoglossum americanum]